MKTISDYSISCTEAQTKKALELGAPLYQQTVDDKQDAIEVVTDGMYNYYEIPTAEEMIGWLETMIYKIYIDSVSKTGWYHIIYIDEESSISNDKFYNSRKEATLAAIDAALEYLTNNKK